MTNKNSSPVSSSVGSCVLRSTGWSLSPGSSGVLSEGPTSITRLSPMRASRPATLSTSPVLVYPVWVVQWYLSWMKRPGHVWEEFFRQRPTWNTLLNVKYFLNSSLIYLYFPPKSGITACLLPCYSTQGPGGCQRKRTKYTSWCHYTVMVITWVLSTHSTLHPPRPWVLILPFLGVAISNLRTLPPVGPQCCFSSWDSDPKRSSKPSLKSHSLPG